MRLPMKFSRWKGTVPTGGVALGADSVPNTGPTKPTPASQDNLLMCSFASLSGWPMHRIAVAYKGPAAAIALSANIALWDEQTQHWYLVGAAQNITPDRLTFFDVVALLAPPQTQAQNGATNGSCEAMLIVSDGATPNGEYVFAMGPDLTTLPL